MQAELREAHEASAKEELEEALSAGVRVIGSLSFLAQFLQQASMFEPKFRREDFFSDAELQALGQLHLLQNVLPVEVSVEKQVSYQT